MIRAEIRHRKDEIMKFVMELIGDSTIEVIGFIAFIGIFILCFFNDGMILQTISRLISLAS